MSNRTTSNNGANIVTLTTDWGDVDFYAGAVKGALYQAMPAIQVVDISHHIRLFDVAHAAYILRNAFPFFPEGTVHIIGVDTEESVVFDKVRSHLAVKCCGHYFVGNDNGIFSMLFDGEKPEEIVELNIPFGNVSNPKTVNTFSTRERFVQAAVHLLNGGSLQEIGNEVEQFVEVFPVQPSYGSDYIKGIVVHTDHFENVITNISEDLFQKIGRGRPFKISFRNYTLEQISKQYTDVPEHFHLALFNSAGLLEIAINRAKASSLLGMRLNDSVLVEFFDE